MVNYGQGRSRVRPISRELAEAEMEKAAILEKYLKKNIYRLSVFEKGDTEDERLLLQSGD